MIERMVRELRFDREQGFLADQTLAMLMSVAGGWRPLPPVRYAIHPVTTCDGVIARHYYSKTRDLLYTEGLPRLLREGRFP